MPLETENISTFQPMSWDVTMSTGALFAFSSTMSCAGMMFTACKEGGKYDLHLFLASKSGSWNVYELVSFTLSSCNVISWSALSLMDWQAELALQGSIIIGDRIDLQITCQKFPVIPVILVPSSASWRYGNASWSCRFACRTEPIKNPLLETSWNWLCIWNAMFVLALPLLGRHR